MRRGTFYYKNINNVFCYWSKSAHMNRACKRKIRTPHSKKVFDSSYAKLYAQWLYTSWSVQRKPTLT